MSFIFVPFFNSLIIHLLFFRSVYTFETTEKKNVFCIFKDGFMLSDCDTQHFSETIKRSSFTLTFNTNKYKFLKIHHPNRSRAPAYWWIFLTEFVLLRSWFSGSAASCGVLNPFGNNYPCGSIY